MTLGSLPYFILFVIFAAMALVGATRPANAQPPWLLFAGAVLVAAIGLRLEVGGDWYVYLRYWKYGKFQDFHEALTTYDPAYGLLNWAVSMLGLRVWVINVVCAAAFTIGLISLCKLQPNPSLGLLVAIPYLVIAVAMGYTRQSAALGLIMLAISNLAKGKTAKTLLYLLLAGAFHKTAVIIIPILALASSQRGMTKFISFVLVAIVGYYLFLSASTYDLISVYVGGGYTSKGALVRAGMNLLPALLLLFYRERLGFDTVQYRFWLIVSLASIACIVILWVSKASFSTAVDRVQLYFIPLQVVVLSRIPSLYGDKIKQSSIACLAIIAYSFAIQAIWLNYGQYTWAWVPYKNYLWAPSGYIEKQHRE